MLFKHQLLPFRYLRLHQSSLGLVSHFRLVVIPPYNSLRRLLIINFTYKSSSVMTYAAKYNKNPQLKLGIVLAAYGVGALLSPLSATAFSNSEHWSHHYLVSLGGTVLSIILLILVFRFDSLDGSSTLFLL